MPTVHDAGYRSMLETRLKSLVADAPRQWGKMRVDQMLWHVNRGLETALGRIPTSAQKRPLPRPILRFMVFTLPWPKGRAPTLPELRATGTYDFDAERRRCLAMIQEVASKDLHASWPTHGTLGGMSGTDWSRLMAKHLDHHLTQFGV